jgi:hypothetical protein
MFGEVEDERTLRSFFSRNVRQAIPGDRGGARAPAACERAFVTGDETLNATANAADVCGAKTGAPPDGGERWAKVAKAQGGWLCASSGSAGTGLPSVSSAIRIAPETLQIVKLPARSVLSADGIQPCGTAARNTSASSIRTDARYLAMCGVGKSFAIGWMLAICAWCCPEARGRQEVSDFC